MPTRPAAIVIDALSIAETAHFWVVALGASTYPPESSTEVIVTLPGWDIALIFIPTTGPKTTKNRIHLDLASESSEHQAETVARLIDMGARRIDIGRREAHRVVMADPEGNEFCVLMPL